MFCHTWVQWVLSLFGVSVFLNSKLWPGMEVVHTQGGCCSSCAASGQKFQWDLAQAELGFVFPSNSLRFNFLHSSMSLLRSFGTISVTSETNSWNNLDIFVQTQQH